MNCYQLVLACVSKPEYHMFLSYTPKPPADFNESRINSWYNFILYVPHIAPVIAETALYWRFSYLLLNALSFD